MVFQIELYCENKSCTFRESLHIPIMVQEVIQYLNIQKEGIYIDCTIGYGGHAGYILERLSSKGN